MLVAGVFNRRWTDGTTVEDGGLSDKVQIVPSMYRDALTQFVHEGPLVGYLVVRKTL